MDKSNESIITNNGNTIKAINKIEIVYKPNTQNRELSLKKTKYYICCVGKGEKEFTGSFLYQKSNYLGFSSDVEVLLDDSCSNLENLKECDIPSSVRKIGKRAFLNCSNLQQVVLREGLKEIDDYAFQGCVSLRNPFTIPASVEKIGKNVFNSSSVNSIRCTEEFAEMYVKQSKNEKVIDLYAEKGDYICVYKINPMRTSPCVRKYFYKRSSSLNCNNPDFIYKMNSFNKGNAEYIGSCNLKQDGTWEILKIYGPGKKTYAGNEEEFNKILESSYSRDKN